MKARLHAGRHRLLLPLLACALLLGLAVESRQEAAHAGPQQPIPVAGEGDRVVANGDLTLTVGEVVEHNAGGQREIVLAAKQYAEDVKSGKITVDLNEEIFESYLMTKDYPPVDVCIRTGGEQRLSNFLLWQLAYAELVFVEEAWPDFTPQRLREILSDTANRERRFGGI